MTFDFILVANRYTKAFQCLKIWIYGQDEVTMNVAFIHLVEWARAGLEGVR